MNLLPLLPGPEGGLGVGTAQGVDSSLRPAASRASAGQDASRAPGPPCSSSWKRPPLLHSSLGTQTKHPPTSHVPAWGHRRTLGGPTMPPPARPMGRARWGRSAGLKRTQRHSANMQQHVTEVPPVSLLLTVTAQTEGPVSAAASAVPCSSVSRHAALREALPSCSG